LADAPEIEMDSRCGPSQGGVEIEVDCYSEESVALAPSLETRYKTKCIIHGPKLDQNYSVVYPILNISDNVKTNIMDCNLVHKELVQNIMANIVYMISKVKFTPLFAQNYMFL
jgi:hypothetical protein